MQAHSKELIADYQQLVARVVELEDRIKEGQAVLKRRNEEADRYRDALKEIATLRFKMGWFDEAKRIARAALDA